MRIRTKIEESENLRKFILRLLVSGDKGRIRLWVKWILLPFYRKMGKGSIIRRNSHMDLLPFNNFYLGQNSIIEDFCTVNNGSGKVYIGNSTRIGSGSAIFGPVTIGDDVLLAQNVVISGMDHKFVKTGLKISSSEVSADQVYIGDETSIGANSVILSGIFIGRECVIAAGSIVTRNVPSYSVVAGNPARIIKL